MFLLLLLLLLIMNTGEVPEYHRAENDMYKRNKEVSHNNNNMINKMSLVTLSTCCCCLGLYSRNWNQEV